MDQSALWGWGAAGPRGPGDSACVGEAGGFGPAWDAQVLLLRLGGKWGWPLGSDPLRGPTGGTGLEVWPGDSQNRGALGRTHAQPH